MKTNNELIKDAVVIPALQGVVVGGMFSSAVTAFVMGVGEVNQSPVLPWGYTWVASFGLVAGGVSLALYYRWIDNKTGRPRLVAAQQYASEGQRMIVMENQPKDYAKGSFVDLPASIRSHQVKRAALIVSHNGWNFSHAALAGENRPFGRKDYELFRDQVCFPRGWIEWKNEMARNQGLCVTRAGRNAFHFLCSPTPRAGVPQ